jgi:hypothetical protein
MVGVSNIDQQVRNLKRILSLSPRIDPSLISTCGRNVASEPMGEIAPGASAFFIGTFECTGCHRVTPRRSNPVRRNWIGTPARRPTPAATNLSERPQMGGHHGRIYTPLKPENLKKTARSGKRRRATANAFEVANRGRGENPCCDQIDARRRANSTAGTK